MKMRIDRKAFGDEVIFSGVSFDIPDGKCTAVLGPSGSGKTTLLRILSGLDRDYEGTSENLPVRPVILFQEDRLVENINAISNLMLVAKDRKTAEEALAASGLGEDGRKVVRELSGGMRRKLAIARFLFPEGDALFLDEPFRALDDESRREAAERILKHRNGRTMVYITHDPDDLSILGADFTIRLS